MRERGGDNSLHILPPLSSHSKIDDFIAESSKTFFFPLRFDFDPPLSGALMNLCAARNPTLVAKWTPSSASYLAHGKCIGWTHGN